MPQVPSARGEFIAGLRAFAPMSMSILPFGVVCGAAASNSGMTLSQALTMIWVIFAGSAQIAATQFFAGGAPLPVILAPPLFFAAGTPTITPELSRVAAALAALAAWRTHSTLLTVVLGMFALWGLQALPG